MAKLANLSWRITRGELVLYRFNIPNRNSHLLASFIFGKTGAFSELTEPPRNGRDRLRHNVPAQRPRATDVRIATLTLSRGSLQPVGWASFFSSLDRPYGLI